jgi:hypothetical protein
VDGTFTSGWDHWRFELLPRNEDLHLVVVREPKTVEGRDSKETDQRRAENRRKRIEIVSPAIRLVDPQRYEIRATVDQAEQDQISFVRVESVIDAVGKDRTGDLVIADPRLGPPVDTINHEKAMELLKRVEAAAAPWLGRTSKAIVSYEYDAIDSQNKTTHVAIDGTSPQGPSWSDISRLRGFAYAPPLRWILSQPENVAIHRVEIGDEHAVLDYRLKSNRGFGAGIGVGPSWNGFFTKPFSAGTIVIDVKTATVVEHRMTSSLVGEQDIESFGDYVAVDQGFAPRSLRIQTSKFDFRFAFRIHKDKLWLVEQASRGDNPPLFKIENVVVRLSE